MGTVGDFPFQLLGVTSLHVVMCREGSCVASLVAIKVDYSWIRMQEKQKQELAPVSPLGPLWRLCLPALPRKRSGGLQAGRWESRKGVGWLSPLSFPWAGSDRMLAVSRGGLRWTFHFISLCV